MKYYLDSNIIIYAMRNQYPSILNHFSNTPSTSIVIPSIVMAELEYGARHSRDFERAHGALKAFSRVFQVIPFTEKAAQFYGIIRENLSSRGCCIGPNDLLIASMVLADNGILVTHNTKEFSRVDNLEIRDWTV